MNEAMISALVCLPLGLLLTLIGAVLYGKHARDERGEPWENTKFDGLFFGILLLVLGPMALWYAFLTFRVPVLGSPFMGFLVLIWGFYLHYRHNPSRVIPRRLLLKLAAGQAEKDSPQAREGVINYLDPVSLPSRMHRVGEVYSDGRLYLFLADRAPLGLTVGQKVTFRLNADGTVVDIEPLM